MDYIHQTMPPNTCLINGGCDWEYFDRCDRVYAISRIVVVKIAGLIDFAQLCNRTICAASKTIRIRKPGPTSGNTTVGQLHSCEAGHGFGLN